MALAIYNEMYAAIEAAVKQVAPDGELRHGYLADIANRTNPIYPVFVCEPLTPTAATVISFNSFSVKLSTNLWVLYKDILNGPPDAKAAGTTKPRSGQYAEALELAMNFYAAFLANGIGPKHNDLITMQPMEGVGITGYVGYKLNLGTNFAWKSCPPN
jgi:hypothetical protein